MVYSGILKNKKKIIVLQSTQIGLSVISNIVLGGTTGAIINTISLVRNIIYYKGKFNTVLKVIFTIISIGLSLYFNNHGIIGLFPMISTTTFIWLIDLKNVNQFKLLLVFSNLLWFVYDLFIQSYTSAVFDFITVVANIVTIDRKNLFTKK